MHIGCCVGANALFGDDAQVARSQLAERLGWFAQIGFDFLELPVSWLAGLDANRFDQIVQGFSASRIDVGSCNLFVPGNLKIVGPSRDVDALREYVGRALLRVKKLKCPYVVLGSGGARSFPAEYPAQQAWDELASFCRLAGDEAAQHGITIVVEPLRYQEANVINSVEAGYAFVRWVGHKYVQLLADSYHMEEVSEPISVLETTAPALRHVHTADTERRHPGAGSYDHQALFQSLEAIDYQGAVSIECRWESFDQEAPVAAAHLGKSLRTLAS